MVIVGKNDCGSIHRQGLFDDLPGINARAVYSAPKQLFEMNNSMPVIEIQAAEQLVRQVPEPGRKKRLRIGRTADRLTRWQRRLEIPPGQLWKCPENCEPGCADAVFGRELFVPCK